MEQLAKHELGEAGAEHAALYAACAPGVALCTIVRIEGSFSRRLGAQLAIHPDGSVTGSLADGCLERQLVTDAHDATGPLLKRYGRGSAQIDFRLPCGGGLDILVDPAPDRAACRAAAKGLTQRRAASLALAPNPLLAARKYIPPLQLRVFGEGPELATLEAIAVAAKVPVEVFDKHCLSLGREPDFPPPDRWTAVILLFHDHEWETALLRQALRSPAFYIGAQGGETARIARTARLLAKGVAEEQVARIRGPVGTIPACRNPNALALSILCEIVDEYERLQPAT